MTDEKKQTFGKWRDLKNATLSPEARARVDAAVEKDLADMSEEKKHVREEFNTVCLVRDDWRCRACGVSIVSTPYSVHHITPRQLMPYGGYVLENGITLCEDCHKCAERFLKLDEASLTPYASYANYALSPYYLYKVIDSSFEKAVYASNQRGEAGECEQP